jgi:hypothetical protein
MTPEQLNRISDRHSEALARKLLKTIARFGVKRSLDEVPAAVVYAPAIVMLILKLDEIDGTTFLQDHIGKLFTNPDSLLPKLTPEQVSSLFRDETAH